MKKIWTVALIAALTFTQTAFAMDLDAAKAGGLVGEMRNGYLGVVKSTPEAEAVVSDINAKRRAEYARIAKQNGQDISVIEKLAAQKAYEMTPKGHYLKDAGGNWVKR